MTKTILRWGLIILLILFAPLFYTEIQGYITTHAAFPTVQAFSVKSKVTLAIIFTAFNFLCAVLTLMITALPCGYLVGTKAKLLAVLITVSVQYIPTYVFFQEPDVGSFATLIWLGQLVAVVISAFAFAELGSRIAAKAHAKSDV